MNPEPNRSFVSRILIPLAIITLISLGSGFAAGLTVVHFNNAQRQQEPPADTTQTASPAPPAPEPTVEPAPPPPIAPPTVQRAAGEANGDTYHLVYELPSGFVATMISIRQNFDTDRSRSNPSCHWQGAPAHGRRFECDMVITHGRTAGFDVTLLPDLDRTERANALHLSALEPDDFGHLVQNGTLTATRNGQPATLVPNNIGNMVHPLYFYLDPSTPCPYNLVRQSDGLCSRPPTGI